MSLKPKKRLGQHFLADRNVARKITGSLRADIVKTVVEIGPGTGSLTTFLLEREDLTIYMIEVDADSVSYLRCKYPFLENRLIHADFLNFDLQDNLPVPVALIGNFPYNISSSIFFKILECKNIVPEVVCMVQKEVAERITASPGSKIYGILSVLLQAWYDVEYLFTVSEKVFVPQPNVKSAVIRLTRNSSTNLRCNEKLFMRVVKTSFNQRRKMISNSLKPIFTGKKPEDGILSMRPEQLTVNDFVCLTKIIEDMGCSH